MSCFLLHGLLVSVPTYRFIVAYFVYEDKISVVFRLSRSTTVSDRLTYPCKLSCLWMFQDYCGHGYSLWERDLLVSQFLLLTIFFIFWSLSLIYWCLLSLSGCRCIQKWSWLSLSISGTPKQRYENMFVRSDFTFSSKPYLCSAQNLLYLHCIHREVMLYMTPFFGP